MIKIAHLTSAHPRFDTRIFYKQCLSFSSTHEFCVNLIVADGKGDETSQSINIIDVGIPAGRLDRAFKKTKDILAEAIKLDAELYHIHDPELIPICLRLLKKKKIVIFDSHEDLVLQVWSKDYLNVFSKYIISNFIKFYERIKIPKFDLVVSATPHITSKLAKYNPNTITVRNFPLLSEVSNNIQWAQRENILCYSGLISEKRGLFEMLSIADNYKLKVFGTLDSEELTRFLSKDTAWRNIDYLGNLTRKDVYKEYSKCKVGLCLLHPIPNHVTAIPTKMFEYMSNGLPLIITDTPYWRSIVEQYECGICVPLGDRAKLIKAVDKLLYNDEYAQKLGNNGIRAIREEANWQKEFDNLYKSYIKLLRTK
ncbi:MAG: glycosyl transferase [Denitrovibrio sp.]|nr:MAG: glycosyl transferase [Denitrovibrio sp.]